MRNRPRLPEKMPVYRRPRPTMKNKPRSYGPGFRRPRARIA